MILPLLLGNSSELRDYSDSKLTYLFYTGLYYDYKTGYYYDAERSLYYDGNTGTYFKYNQETKEYVVSILID